MAQYAQDMAKAKSAVTINLVMSVFITSAALLYMFIMDSFAPEYTDTHSAVIYVPTITLLAISMWLLVKPLPMEW